LLGIALIPRHNNLNSAQERLQIRRQQRALVGLEDAEAALWLFHRCLPPEDFDDDFMERAFQEAVLGKHKSVGAAIRAGLGHHPLVLPWIESQGSLGQRALLRRTHAGLEKGVRRPLKPDEVLLASEVSKLTGG
jgi:hypothetical protein